MTRPHVVIIGGGFGGLHAARGLRHAPVDVTLIDRTNHHLFQPLLYQVAMASLAPSDITAPIRWLLRRQRNTRVLLGNVSGIDTARRTVHVDGEAGDLHYDYLIVASGARHAYFGHDEWSEFAPGLKTLDDAMEVRRRFLLAFEQAELTDDDAERAALLTIAIVGGGPTGVELAGMLPDVARALRADFRSFDATRLRVVLLEGGPRILPTFPAALAEHARKDLTELGAEVRTGARVTTVDGTGVWVGGEFIPARTVFWAAGNKASSLGHFLGVPLDNAGRVTVKPDLTIGPHPEILVAGDLAACMREDGSPVPGVCPAAIQMGAYAARHVRASLRGETLKPFHYRNKGELATIGRHRAIADFGVFTVTGYLAWFFWLFVHILYLVGFRNRLSVLIQWGYMYLTYRRGVRLITASEVVSPRVTGDWPVK
ncbi:MAG TPA: NAD(P)/FAD-dependent oxidoreductase [Gemmatimonadaceae bacterium]|nr:NAD(P)/FAD-dependent oxidoreductase [Gemmatimonadaceae bacterium]